MLICLTSLTQEEDKIILNKETGIELTEIPLTTQRKPSKHLRSDEDLYDGHEEDGIFTTQQLFSFAWQIARGMVRPRSFFHTERSSSVKVHLTPKYFIRLNKSLHLFSTYCAFLN